MEDTKMSISNTWAKIYDSQSVEKILSRIKGTEFKSRIEGLRSILHKEGKSTAYTNAKERLLGFAPSGVFNGMRDNKSLDTTTYSQIFVIDVDNLKDSEHVKKVKHAATSETTLSVFISPSGLGCKILVKVESTPEIHKEVYQQLMDFYNAKFATLDAICDGKCMDLSHLHYFSYDPEIHINWKSQIFKPKEVSMIQKDLKVSNSTNDDKVKRVEEFTQKKIRFKDGRNNYVLQLACNLNRFSVEENAALEYIIGKYEEDSFTEREILTVVKGVYKRYESEFGKYITLPEHDSKKKYDYAKIREDLALNKLEPNQYFSLIFQSNENEDTGAFNCLIEDFKDIYEFLEDEILSYFSSQIVENQNFDNSIFAENPDATINNAFQTLLNDEVLPSDDRKQRILIADFKSEFLNLHYQSLLRQQPFQRKENIAEAFKELNRISALSNNQTKIAKALLEDCFDNPL